MRSRRVGVAVLVFVVLGAAVLYWCLYTEMGIFVVGHWYWMHRAGNAESADAARAHLERVVGATQYGVNFAQQGVRRVSDPRRRVELWNMLIELAPNDHWRAIYASNLQNELATEPAIREETIEVPD